MSSGSPSAVARWWDHKARHWRFDPPIKTSAVVLVLAVISALVALLIQFRGGFTAATRLTLVGDRSGLVMDPGAKVTFNGVRVGRVTAVRAREWNGTTKAELSVDIQPRYIKVIPANSIVEVEASTMFGNKFLSLSSPRNPVPARISEVGVIDITHVTTEFDSLFETMTSISEKIDPVKLNLMLSSTAEALTGMGSRLGRALADSNAVLDELNPHMPGIREQLRSLNTLAEIYTRAAPDFVDSLDQIAGTAATLNRQRRDLDSALLAAIGFADNAADITERGGPYFVRFNADLRPTSALFDLYSPEIFCTIRNYANLLPLARQHLGGNGYAMRMHMGMLPGAQNPYIYPDNLPRVNARGGPAGAPGCWMPVTRDFWPAPMLVADTGVSLAPYNHFEIGQPNLLEYVWGRQSGEMTINP